VTARRDVHLSTAIAQAIEALASEQRRIAYGAATEDRAARIAAIASALLEAAQRSER